MVLKDIVCEDVNLIQLAVWHILCEHDNDTVGSVKSEEIFRPAEELQASQKLLYGNLDFVALVLLQTELVSLA
jgi:hypothetical protein